MRHRVPLALLCSNNNKNLCFSSDYSTWLEDSVSHRPWSDRLSTCTCPNQVWNSPPVLSPFNSGGQCLKAMADDVWVLSPWKVGVCSGGGCGSLEAPGLWRASSYLSQCSLGRLWEGWPLELEIKVSVHLCSPPPAWQDCRIPVFQVHIHHTHIHRRTITNTLFGFVYEIMCMLIL